MKTTVQISVATRKKLKAISDKRKKQNELPNKQIEILTELINKTHNKEVKQ